MRAYKINADRTLTDGDKDSIRFAGIQGGASKKRQELVNEYPGLKKAQVEIEEIDIPTGKVDLLEFLNTLVA